METRKLHNEIVKGYSASTAHEWIRLTRKSGIMEYLTTVRYLEKYLPKGGLVADIGSGPGRYSLWLAEHGYRVVAVDPVESSIRSLRARFRTRGLYHKLDAAHVGFAQDLGMLESGSFDAVVCLGGPISHIMSEKERRSAAMELVRIAKPGAPIFASVMGRFTIFGGTVGMFQADLDSKYIEKWAETGDYFGGYGFLPFHGFRPDELEGLFGNKVELLAKTALEGFASYNDRQVEKLMRNKKRWNRWLRIHFSISEEPETIGVSEHYMVVAKAKR
jgi:SAM-dependent methyltransferase